MTIPFHTNACSGYYKDWLEVMLTPVCNAHCEWCVEHDGWHPEEQVSCHVLIQKILSSPRKNIILLGGEPTLYPKIQELISKTKKHKNIWITTNGSKLNPTFMSKLKGITGLNISIHGTLDQNETITGIKLNEKNLKTTLALYPNLKVRLNCNLIKGVVDNLETVSQYIEFAKRISVSDIRFAELKNDTTQFVSACDIFGEQYGLNENPFKLGCSKNFTFNGVNLNIRQMCGFQTKLRPKPKCFTPTEIEDSFCILYYNGKFYNNWQLKKDYIMTKKDKELQLICIKMISGEITVEEGIKQIKLLTTPKPVVDPFCRY